MGWHLSEDHLGRQMVDICQLRGVRRQRGALDSTPSSCAVLGRLFSVLHGDVATTWALLSSARCWDRALIDRVESLPHPEHNQPVINQPVTWPINQNTFTYLSPPRRLCFCRFLFVCLSVCLSVVQDNSKNYGRIFLKFWGYVGHDISYKWLNFGGDPAGILDSGLLWNFRFVLKGA